MGVDDWLNTDRFIVDVRLMTGEQLPCTEEQFPRLRLMVQQFMEEMYNQFGSEHRWYKHAQAELNRLTEQFMTRSTGDDRRDSEETQQEAG